MSSSQDIRYDLRPAKHIERKMMCEIFQRLIYRIPEEYQYIGFGSVYFTDFYLFHKALGISDMTTIEEKLSKDRVEFNRPFDCIKFLPNKSHIALPKVKWKKKSILWLDYDQKLSQLKLEDVKLFCNRATSGSFIIVSLNAQPEKGKNIPSLMESVDNDYITRGLKEEDLVKWGLAAEYKRIIHRIIQDEIATRNNASSKELRFAPLINFNYADNVNMMTFGGIIFDSELAQEIDICRFETLPFVRTGESPYEIKVPIITNKERLKLEALFPNGDVSELINKKIVTAKNVELYKEIYKWFPNYADIQW